MAPPSLVQLIIFHGPLVLHGQIKVVYPLAIMLVSAIDDTHARMNRLEQRFQQLRIFDGVTSWDGIDVCASHSPIAQIHDIDV